MDLLFKVTYGIIAGTVVNGDIGARALAAAIEVLPRPPGRIVIVETKELRPTKESQLRGLDAFVLCGSRVIYLRREGPALLAAEHSGGPYILMLAVIISMAHTRMVLTSGKHKSGKRTSGSSSSHAAVWKLSPGCPISPNSGGAR